MNGAELLMKAAVARGIRICFSNPGTTELPLVAAIDQTEGMRPVLGLFEGVCTGAADGYGRVASAPALTLLHLGPGLANGIANLHNAKRAGTPILNVIGEHATWHKANDPPLAMDIEALAGTVSGWKRTVPSADTLIRDLMDGVTASLRGRVATLIVPHDIQRSEVVDKAVEVPLFVFDPIDAGAIVRAARLLKSRRRSVLILGGRALRRNGLQAAARVKAATGCDLLCEALPGYIERGAGLPIVQRIPYFPEVALGILSQYESVVLAGTGEPVTFFGYPGIPGKLLKEDQQKEALCADGQDAILALQNLADALDAPSLSAVESGIFAPASRPGIPSGVLTPDKVCATLAALQPENAIIIDEGLTGAFSYFELSAGAPYHALMTTAGGAIGCGMPCSAGAAIAAPDRRVIDFQADGSGLYTVQALWTQARESLDVTTLICSNRSYRILEVEFGRSGMFLGPASKLLTSLSGPVINWVDLSRGFGVPAVSVDTAETLARELNRSLSEAGPHLVEMLL